MNPRFPAFDYVGGHQLWQSLQPKTGGFSLPMPKHPRLNNLVGFSDAAGNDADRVFKSYARYRRIQKPPDKHQSVGLFFGLFLKPARTRNGQMRAGRMGYQQVPPLPDNVQNVALVMWPRLFSRQQVATDRVMPRRMNASRTVPLNSQAIRTFKPPPIA